MKVKSEKRSLRQRVKSSGIVTSMFILCIFSAVLCLSMLSFIFFNVSVPAMFSPAIRGFEEAGFSVPVKFSVSTNADTVGILTAVIPGHEQITIKETVFETGVIEVKTDRFADKALLLFPELAAMILLMIGTWQLALLLDNFLLQKIFLYENYTRLKRVSACILIYQLILFIASFVTGSYVFDIVQQKPGTNQAILLTAKPDYHIQWIYVVAAIIIYNISTVFQNGYYMKKDQDLTI